MKHFHKPIQHYMLILLFGIVPFMGTTQNIISYAYDYAGNRISRRVVNLTPTPPHVRKQIDTIPTPVVEKLGDRMITIYPNPTKGALAVDITGGDSKPASAGGDEISITLFSAQGVQLQSTKTTSGRTPVEMANYPPGWYVLRVKAGEKLTEFKIIKQ